MQSELRDRRIAEAISSAWHNNTRHQRERLDVAIGALAALTLPAGSALRDAALMTDVELASVLERVWGMTWINEPFLVETALPLHRWLLEDPDAELLAGARAVLRAAGEYDLPATGPWQPRESDLLGAVLTAMRSSGAASALAEEPTPIDVAELLARLTLAPDGEPPEPGRSFHEPTAGTGGIMLATARAIRAAGGDPGDYQWVMGDLDPLSAAVSAVNAILWALGPDVLVYCADALAEPDAPAHAALRRAGVLAHHANQIGIARLREATAQALALETRDENRRPAA